MDKGKSETADGQKRFPKAGGSADPTNVQLWCVDGNKI